MNKFDDFMMIEEAAAFLGVTANTLRNWERARKLKSYRHPFNKYRLYKKEELEKLLNSIQPAQ